MDGPVSDGTATPRASGDETSEHSDVSPAGQPVAEPFQVGDAELGQRAPMLTN